MGSTESPRVDGPQMRVAIVGAGSLGRSVGRILVHAGYEVCLSWASSPDRLQAARADVGPGAFSATPHAAVAWSDIVLFAPRFEHVEQAAAAVGSFDGVVVIDTTNHYTPKRDGLVDLGDRTSAQTVRAKLCDASYVKGFNTLTGDFLHTVAGRHGPERVVLFLSGDDPVAKRAAATLAEDTGFAPVDLGDCAGSRAQEPGGRYFGYEFRLTDVPDLPRLRAAR